MELTAEEFAQHPKFALDLTKSHFRRQYGNLTLYGSWFGKKRSPVLVLLPANREHFSNATPCVIPLASAYKWAGDPDFALDNAHDSFRFALALNLDAHNPFTLSRITTIIRDNIGDLLLMPPYPESERAVVADATITDVDGRTRDNEITAYV